MRLGIVLIVFSLLSCRSTGMKYYNRPGRFTALTAPVLASQIDQAILERLRGIEVTAWYLGDYFYDLDLTKPMKVQRITDSSVDYINNYSGYYSATIFLTSETAGETFYIQRARFDIITDRDDIVDYTDLGILFGRVKFRENLIIYAEQIDVSAPNKDEAPKTMLLTSVKKGSFRYSEIVDPDAPAQITCFVIIDNEAIEAQTLIKEVLARK